MTALAKSALLLALVATAAAAAPAGDDDLIFSDAFESAIVVPPLDCEAIRDTTHFRVNAGAVTSDGVTIVARNLTSLRGLHNGPMTRTRWYLSTDFDGYLAMAVTGAQIIDDLGSTSVGLNVQAQVNYQNALNGSITVSRCEGDFRRASTVPDNDPARICTSRFFSDTAVYLSVGDTASTNPRSDICTIARNELVYVNLIFADIEDGLEPNEIACSPGVNRCGTRFSIQ